MFTGIAEGVGIITSLKKDDDLVRIESEKATIELLNKNIETSLIRNLELLDSNN